MCRVGSCKGTHILLFFNKKSARENNVPDLLANNWVQHEPAPNYYGLTMSSLHLSHGFDLIEGEVANDVDDTDLVLLDTDNDILKIVAP